jgi:D-alanyl-D-alanine carboxypeptidase
MSIENPNKQRVVKILRIIMPIVGIMIGVIIAPLDLLPAWIAPLPDTVQEQVDRSVEQGLDGVIVYVDQAGEEPVFYTAGVQNKRSQEPIDPNSYFKIASIHKLYIATAIAKLDSAGSLSVDDTLSKHMPELEGRIEYADQITIRMLVQHRSGIPNYTDDSEFDWLTPLPDGDSVLDLVLDDPADFEPDTEYRYSNTNYFLLERIIDKVLGYSHRQYVYDEVLAPIGLTNTFFSINDVDLDDLVSGYLYEDDEDLKYLDQGMVATAADVGTFLRALNDGTLLNDDEQAIYSSLYEYGHDGWMPGYHSMARYHADIDTVVVQFASTVGGETWGTANIIGGKATALSNIVYSRILRILRKQ